MAADVTYNLKASVFDELRMRHKTSCITSTCCDKVRTTKTLKWFKATLCNMYFVCFGGPKVFRVRHSCHKIIKLQVSVTVCQKHKQNSARRNSCMSWKLAVRQSKFAQALHTAAAAWQANVTWTGDDNTWLWKWDMKRHKSEQQRQKSGLRPGPENRLLLLAVQSCCDSAVNTELAESANRANGQLQQLHDAFRKLCN